MGRLVNEILLEINQCYIFCVSNVILYMFIILLELEVLYTNMYHL